MRVKARWWSPVLMAGLLLTIWRAGLIEVRAAEGDGCPIFPVPREYAVKAAAPVALSPDAVIVVGDQATAPEKYAAGLLQRLVERRYKLKLALKTEAEAGTPALAILVGTRAGNKQLDAECAKRKVDIAADKPVADAFALDTAGTPALIAGSNPRSTIYAADAFFALLTRDGEKVAYPAVCVRDWPAIPWRGRPGYIADTQPMWEPDYIDPMIQNRASFTDIRGGEFGFRPVDPISPTGHERYETFIKNAHSAGLFVYGTVACGEADHARTLAKFKEIIGMKVDGLWISFDDTGTGAKDPVGLIKAVLDLGKEHGMTGRAIAITPPNWMKFGGGDKKISSYKTIDTPFNRDCAKIPGFDEATWFFTRLPCADDLKTAREIGMKSKPAWWHNWPRPNAGFTHSSRQLLSLRKGGKTRGYIYYPGMDEMNVWAFYDYPCSQAELTKHEFWKYTDTTWGWGGGAQEYVDGTFLPYVWNPENYDWKVARRAAYARVFGPAQMDAGEKYDDALQALLKDVFEKYYYGQLSWDIQARAKLPPFPYRLAKGQTRDKAVALLDGMQSALDQIKMKAVTDSAIRSDRLETWYLEQMQATIRIARGVLDIPFPSRDWNEVVQTLDKLLKDGKVDEAKALVTQIRKEYPPELFKAIREKLADIEMDYYFFWEVKGPQQLDKKIADVEARK